MRDVDRDLLGVDGSDGPGAFTFTVVEHLCRTDGRFYGGAALAAALMAIEHVSGRDALWASTQLVGTAALGERIDVRAEVVAAGRSVDQVLVRATTGERVVFAAVGSAASAREGGIEGRGQVMPRVPPPERCEPWRGLGPETRWSSPTAPPGSPAIIGHHLVSEHREAPLLDPDPDRPGRMALWARLDGERAPHPAALTPAVLGFLADMVPLSVCRACGVDGAGTSLDNTVRIGAPGRGEWVLLDLDAHAAVGGFGHGQVHLWSEDGDLLGTGSQSALLFSIDDFVRRRREAGAG